MGKVKEDKMEYLMQIAEERYRKNGKELSDSEKDSIYYSILGVYRNENYGVAYNYVLSAKLSLWVKWTIGGKTLNSFENDKVKVAYYGGVIESIQAFVDGYKNAVKQNGELLSIEYLEFLAAQTISHAKEKLNSFELGKGYLIQSGYE